MARDRGHEVLFTTPYYSDLQPIDLVWAAIKGNMGKIVDNVDNVIKKFVQEIDDSDDDEFELEIESKNGRDTVSDISAITDSDCE